MKKRVFIGLVVLFISVMTYGATSTRPNILLILVDDLGYGDLSCMGAKDMRTPHLDKLMASGLRMDRFYANCPVCSPTRAALLTGRYPDLAGVPGVIRTHQANSWGYLKQGIPLLPGLLKQKGYHTAIIGKWHLGLASPNTPLERGFDLFHGFLGDMMDDYWHHRRHGQNYMVRDGKGCDPEGHATDLFTQWAMDYLSHRKDQQDSFFLYLAYNAPHTPIQPPKDWLKKVKARQPELPDKRAKLVAFIEHMDDGIGRVLQRLKGTGLQRDTLVVFTSDNGGQVNVGADNGALRGGKQQMFEGGIRVPFCAVWPGRIRAGDRDTDHVALTMDLFPTLCAVAGIEAPGDIDGRNMLPLLTSQRGQIGDWPERPLFWVRREGGHYQGRAYYAMQKGRYKLLQNTAFEPMQLFDLIEDPMEQKPLPASHPKAKELSTLLRNHINRAGAVPWAKDPVDISEVYPGF